MKYTYPRGIKGYTNPRGIVRYTYPRGIFMQNVNLCSSNKEEKKRKLKAPFFL